MSFRRPGRMRPESILRRHSSDYVDEADGVLEKRADGKMAMTRVTLRPHVTWGADAPDEAALADLHLRAHEACFIANSVTTEVTVEH